MLPQNKKELQTDTCAHRVLLLSKIKPVLYFQLILDRAKCICRSTHSASVSLPQHTETNSVHCSVRTYRWKLMLKTRGLSSSVTLKLRFRCKCTIFG